MGRYPSDCPEGYKSIYFVISGDTVSIIAKRFGISATDLIAVNQHISNPDELYPGDALCVPGFRKPVNCPADFQGRYEVQYGDSMFSVAQRFNVSEEKLTAANPQITNPDMIFPFDELCVPKTNESD